jgi:hypothetical protein
MRMTKTFYTVVALVAFLISFLGFLGMSDVHTDGLALFLSCILIAVYMFMNRPVYLKASQEKTKPPNPLISVVERVKSAEKGYLLSRKEISNLVTSLYALRKEGKVPEDYNSMMLWRKRLIEWLGDNNELRSLIEINENDHPKKVRDGSYLNNLSYLIDLVKSA